MSRTELNAFLFFESRLVILYPYLMIIFGYKQIQDFCSPFVLQVDLVDSRRSYVLIPWVWTDIYPIQLYKDCDEDYQDGQRN